jgi:hypothetical protein
VAGAVTRAGAEQERRTFQFRELRLDAFPAGRVAAEPGIGGRPGGVNFAAFPKERDLARNAVARPWTMSPPTGAGAVSLRWVYTHMMEEYARHNGHADRLQQRIDGAAGS